MSARVEVRGLVELRKQISDMPEDIQAQAAVIVREATEGARTDLQAAYPSKTGTLRARVRTAYQRGGLSGRMNSQAPHSHLYEEGTKVRQNKRGANRGRMKATPETPGIATRRRFIMFRQLIAMLRSLGFTVNA